MTRVYVDVLIVGGGFSGTMLAVHLLRCDESLSIAILDRGTLPGRGLAYGTPHRFHLLNAPAGKMSAWPDDPDDFVRWAKGNYSQSVQPRSFLPRSLYGEYVGNLLARAVADHGSGRFRWIQGEATSLRPRKNRLIVRQGNGSEVTARAVVLATGNFPPANPQLPGLDASASCYVPFAWSKEALENLPASGSVLLIGSGLTSLDTIMALKSKGFKGAIYVHSRRGVLPQAWQQSWPWPLFWNDKSPRTTRGLLRLIRDQVSAASATGVDWRSVIDCLRPVTHRIWQSLPVVEQRRFLRHVRPYWEAHRHRVPPQIADVLFDMKEEGQLFFSSGRITSYTEEDGTAHITYRRRGGSADRELRVDRVVNCTGSETDCRRIDDSVITGLFAQGVARPDSLFLGLDVTEDGAVRDRGGEPSTSIFAIGPTRKGCLWETTAVTEIREQCVKLADHLGQALRAPRPFFEVTETEALVNKISLTR